MPLGKALLLIKGWSLWRKWHSEKACRNNSTVFYNLWDFPFRGSSVESWHIIWKIFQWEDIFRFHFHLLPNWHVPSNQMNVCDKIYELDFFVWKGTYISIHFIFELWCNFEEWQGNVCDKLCWTWAEQEHSMKMDTGLILLYIRNLQNRYHLGGKNHLLLKQQNQIGHLSRHAEVPFWKGNWVGKVD